MTGVLRIRGEDGNFYEFPVISGKDGEDGKSAYEIAVEGGYKGTEEDFVKFLNTVLDQSHIDNKSNPHEVNAEQVGAFPSVGGTITGDVNVYSAHHPMVKVGCDGANTSTFFYTQNKTVDIYNWTNGEPTTISLGNANSMLLRDVLKIWVGANDYQVYGDHNANELGIAKVATGTYVGTGTGGVNNPTLLTFPFTPKVAFISLVSEEANRCDGTLPLVNGSRIGLVCVASSSNWSSHSVYPLNLVWDANTLFISYTLNNTSVDQRQLNISGMTYRWLIYG